MKKFRFKRRSAGFTLTEVMVTIGILVVLFVLAFPVMTYFSLSLKMNQVDAGARNIFVAAQNQMVALRASNDVSALSSAKPLTGKPSDFSGSNWASLSYLSSADTSQTATLKKLLPDGAIDPALAGGCYTIEFDPSTYRIYSVFYSESTFSYKSDSMPRDLSSRKAHNPPLGYYGGGVLEAAGTATPLPAPQITLTNNDELNISFTTNNVFSGLVSDPDFFYGLTYTVLVASANDSTKNVSFHDSSYSLDGFYAYKLTTPLDSLTGAHFKDVCSVIPPGDDIKITVIVTYSDTARVTLPASSSVITNSLFMGRSNSEVTVATARHLQNLEPTVSGISSASSVSSAVQAANIDWSAAGTQKFVPISNSLLNSYNGNGLNITALNVAITSGDAGLFGNFQGSILTNIQIVDPKFSGGTYSGALAGRCTGASTTITGCGVYVSDVSHASNYTISGTTHAGGLIGYTNTPILITDSFAAPYSVSGASSSLGGLIGYCGAGNSSFYIARCYANTDKASSSAAQIGGLIGRNGGTNVKDCYALGNIKAVYSSYIGGLSGYSSGASYTNCYAAPSFTDNTGGIPYGFSGSNITASDCASLKGTDFTSGTPSGSVSPISYTSLINWSGGASWTASVLSTSHPYDAGLISQGKPFPFPHLKTSHHYNNWPVNSSAAAVFTYYEIYSDGTYGYYALDNSGAELLNTLSNAKGAVVGDGYALITQNSLSSLSYTYQSSAGDTATGNLSDLGSSTINAVTYKTYALQSDALNGKYAASAFYQYVTINDNTFWYNPHFAKAAINGASSRPVFNGTAYLRSTRQFANLSNYNHKVYWSSDFKYLQEIDIDFSTYPFSIISAIGTNPTTNHEEWSSGFSGYGTAFSGTYDGGGRTVTINSSSSNPQNAIFAYNSGTIKNLNIVTSGDISMGKWDSDPCAVLVGVNVSVIQGCTVTLGASLDMTTNIGCGILAYSNFGTISDCLVISSASVTAKSVNGSASLGGFVNSNSGTITRCFVRPGSSSYSALTIKAAKAAGFTAYNSGTITNCSATAYVTEIWSDSSSCSAAGFVYNNADYGVITSSYANCVVKSHYAAGFAYNANGYNSSIQNCYSMVTVTAFAWNQGTGSGFVYSAGNGNVNNCYVSAKVTGATTYTFSGNGTLGTNCRFYQWSLDGAISTGTASSLSALRSAYSGGVWGSASTHVFRDQFTDITDSCPFPMIAGLDHYGDWSDTYSDMFSYYEKYSDNTYGYYVMQTDGTVLLDTLSDSNGALIEDGYMLLTRDALTNKNISGDTGGGTLLTLDRALINIDGTDLLFYRYSLPTYILNTDSCSSSFYMRINISNTNYYYNPHFANAAYTDALSTPSFDGKAYIRSSRQFANLASSNHSTYWGSGYSIYQQLSIDFSTYSISITSPVGTSSSLPFLGTYDGGNYTLTINSNAKSYRNALFGYNSGTIKNLNIATSGSFTMGDSNSGSALLAATNTGTIQNCSVIFGADFGFTGTSFGIIANSNSGTITGCIVTSSVPVEVSTNSSVNLGGFVYTNSGTISYSYVRPDVTTYASLTLKGKNTAGFVYNNTGGSVTFCSVTAAVSVINPAYSGYNAAGFVYTASGGAISRCYSNCVVTANNAAGFAYDCSSSSTISYCYAMLKVSANMSDGFAAGFALMGSSKISYCYAATQVSGKNAYYFCSDKVDKSCRYLDWSGNGNTNGGNATASTLAQLRSSFASSPWGSASSYPYWDLYSVSSPCNFPLIAGLDHYGDWPPV